MEKSFYIPINSGSLAHYFSKAIILPAKYFTNKPEDIQNRFADSLLLSESKWVRNCDCSIEIVLTEAEVKELAKVSDRFYLYNTPIPVSRVKSVVFLDAKQKETTIWNINNGAAFVPEGIVSVEKNKDIDILSDTQIEAGRELKSNTEFSDKIKKFDVILGGFAFMRLGGKSFMNYSENYFSTLSYFNKLVEEQTLNAAKEKGLKFSDKYIGLFSKQESEWSKWQQYIYQNLDAQEIEVLADKEGIHIEKKLGLLKIDSINPSSHLYELAILATYGDRKNKSADNLVTDLSNGTIAPEKVEDVALLFGLNCGYSRLRNRYKNNGHDCNVKFSMESKLDYYIIESIFQYAFYEAEENYSFDYIDKIVDVKPKFEDLSYYEAFNILDTLVVWGKKQPIHEKIVEKYFNLVFEAKYFQNFLPPFLEIIQDKLVECVQPVKKSFEREIKNIIDFYSRDLKESYEKQYNYMVDFYEKKLHALEQNNQEKISQEEISQVQIRENLVSFKINPNENVKVVSLRNKEELPIYSDLETVNIVKSDKEENNKDVNVSSSGVVNEPSKNLLSSKQKTSKRSSKNKDSSMKKNDKIKKNNKNQSSKDQEMF